MTTEETAQKTIYSPRFVLGVVLFFLLLSGLIAIVQLRGVTSDLAEGQERAQETRSRILALQRDLNSCINPKGECAKRGANQSNNLIAASVICGKDPEITTKEEALDCVVRIASTPVATQP